MARVKKVQVATRKFSKFFLGSKVKPHTEERGSRNRKVLADKIRSARRNGMRTSKSLDGQKASWAEQRILSMR